MSASLKKSILLSLLILALGAAARLLQQQHLSVQQENYRKLTAEAGPLGVTGDPSEPRLTKRQREQRDNDALALAGEWIALTREMEEFEKRGERPDEAFSQRSETFLTRLEGLDVSQLKRIINEVRGNRQISEKGRRTIITASIQMITEAHPGAALAMFLECSELLGKNEDSNDVMTTALSHLATTNPQATAEWIERNSAVYAATADDFTHTEVLDSIAGTDPKLAFKLIGSLHPEDPSDAIQTIIGTSEDNPEKRDAILAALRDHLATLSNAEDREQIRDEAFEAFAQNIGKEGIDSVSRWIEKSKLSPEEKARFASGLSYSATEADTGRWIEWMSENVPAENLTEPVQDLVGDWTQQDYQASGKWLAATPESPAKHTAVLAYAAAIAEYEPQVAGQWAMTLPPGPVRDETLKVIYQNWPGSDPVGAAAFAREHGME
ncbi:MAG: hypothetical protein V4819_09910 [Verrucomicrobiota bacterium]